MPTRESIEEGFGRWAEWVAEHPAGVILTALLLVGAFGSQLVHLAIDTSNESYLLEGDEVRRDYDRLRNQFGRDEVALIAVEPLEVFDVDFLRYLSEFHSALEDGVPHLDRVTSLVNVRSVEGRGDELIVGDLLETIPETEEALDAFRERVLSTPSYLGGVISEDGQIAIMILETNAYSDAGGDEDELAGFESSAALDEDFEPEFLRPEENAAFVEASKAIAQSFERPETRIYIAGSSMIPHEITAAMSEDVPRFFGGALLTVALVLFSLFRRIAPCLIALVVVAMALIATMGATSLLGMPISLMTQIIPSFLLAVGVGYSVHILAIYDQQRSAGRPQKAALSAAFQHAGPPILMTAMTTAAGLASFFAAEMPPMRHFGLTAMIGVGWALLFNLALLPALLCLAPDRPREISTTTKPNRFLVRFGMASARHPWRVVAGTAALTLVAILFCLRIEISNNPIEYLAPEKPFRVAHQYLDDRLNASVTLELLLEGNAPNALHDPEVLRRIDALETYFEDFEYEGHRFGRTTSIVDIVKETHQALNANDPADYAIPDQRDLVAQELLLFENTGADDVERIVDPQFQIARYTIASIFEDGNKMAPIVDKIEREIPAILGEDVRASATGTMALISRTVVKTGTSLARTYTLAIFIITPLMMFLIGSLRLGLVSMVPNLLPVLVTMAAIPVFGWTLDIFTMMVGCIAIGLAVDDTLHFIHGFRSRYEATGDADRAIEETLETTGRALLLTSVVLCAGFLVLTLSSMSNLRAMGFLTAFAIMAAFVLDILVTPALLILANKGRKAKSSA